MARPARILPLLLLLAGTAHAQPDTLRLPFTALTIDDGLAQGMVASIAQDKYGFLWFATKDGLDRYDGYSFTTFRHDPADSTTIAENTVNALYVDRAQRLWVVTNSGVDLFDPTTEHFRHVPIKHPNGPMREVRMVTVDAHGDLWVCSKNRFVKVTFAQPVEPGKPLPACTLRWFEGYAALTRFSDDRLWGTLGSNVLIITPDHAGADVMDTVPPWPEAQLRNYDGLHFVEDTVRGLVHGLGNDYIITIDRRKKGAAGYAMHALPATSLGANGFTVDGTGMLWATSLQGPYRYDPAERRLVPVEAIDPAHAKALQHLKSCFVDRGGTVWFGSSGYGLLKYDPRTGRFNKWEDRSVIALNPTRSGKVLVGRLVAGLAEFDPQRRIMDMDLQRGASGTPGNEWRNGTGDMAVEDGHGTLWVGLGWGKILRYDRAGDGRMAVFRPVLPSGVAETSPLFPLMIGRQNTLWFGGELALWRCDVRTNALTPFPWPVPSVRDPYHFTAALYEGEDGRVWAGTMRGLMRLDPVTGDWRHYVHDAKDPRSLANNVVFSICPDTDDPTGVLWIGTNGGGLNRFDVRTGKVERITMRDGLPNDVVYGVLADGEGRLWMSTNKGIARYDCKTGAFRTFTVHDGLQSNEFNRNAYCKTADGTLFFGGVNGFNYFRPEALTEDSTASPIQLTGIKLINKAVDFHAADAPITVPAYLSTGMTIPHSTNIVAFEFATLEFASPGNHRYRYKLEGFDRDWVEAGTDRSAVYTNLDPGTYTFRVRGDNRDGIWDPQGTSFMLTVQPPWWRTWWAYALYVLAVAGGIITYIRLRTSGLRRQRAHLEHTVVQRTSELLQAKERAEHSEKVKEQFLANMSHEIRTPMNAIVGMSKVLLRNEHLPAQQQQLDAIATSSDNLLDIVNEILDLSRIEAGKLQLERVPMEPRRVVNNVMEVLRHRVEEKGLQTWVRVEWEVPQYVVGDPARLSQVLMNLVGNAIKFTEVGIIGLLVSVKEQLSDAVMLEFEVHDSGIGIAADRLGRVFEEFMQAESDHTRKYGGTGLGLPISKRLVEMQGGTIEVVSTQGQGSTFSFRIPYGGKARDLGSQYGPAEAEVLQPLRDLRILLAEDNKLNVLVAREELQYAVPGVQVDVAVNGQAAVDLHTANTYDLILMDVQMPVMDGYAATRAIRAMAGAKGRIPVVAMTANVLEAQVRQCHEAGMDGFIPKPFTREQLLEAMARSLRPGRNEG